MAQSPFNPAANGWTLVPDTGFIDLVGPFWSKPQGSLTSFGFLAVPKHANLIDVVQGGMLMTFGDRVLGISAWSAAQDRPCVTIHFDMQFVSSAQMGEFIELTPEIVRCTNSLVFMRGDLVVGSKLIATANGIWKILHKQKDSA